MVSTRSLQAKMFRRNTELEVRFASAMFCSVAAQQHSSFSSPANGND